MGFFNGVQAGSSNVADQDALNKALSAGYGTDSSTFTGGRAMIPEDLEATAVNVVATMKDDCKLLGSLKTKPVSSTMHEYNRRTGFGNHRFLSVAEGGITTTSNQDIERKALAMKYLQTRRAVTLQMQKVNSFENALDSETTAGIEVLAQGTEYMMFHGNSAVIPTEFDGLLAQIKAADSRAYIQDARGASIGTLGEGVFDDIAREVWERHGDLKKAFFPAVLAKDIKAIFDDKLRYVVNNGNMGNTGFGLPAHTTAIGSTIQLSGAAGADKFFQVKGVVTADGPDRPIAPASVTVAAASATGSKFAALDAGDYLYTVHAVSNGGISAGTSPAAAVSVAAGNGVTLTITAGTGSNATGYIICRSAKDGDTVMEMTQIPVTAGGTTIFVDLNTDLPGTAEIVAISEGRSSPIITFDQLSPISRFNLAATNTAEVPFLIYMFGALQNSAPEQCSVIKNLHYQGGLY